MSFIVPFSPGKTPITAALTDHAVQTGLGTNWTFSGLSFGAAFAKRQIVVLISYSPASPQALPSSFKINGTTVPPIGSVTVGSFVVAYTLAVPAGATGTVDVVLTTNSTFVAVSVYAISDVFTSTAYNMGIANPLAATVAVAQGGAVVAMAESSAATGSPTYPWTGLTRDYQATFGGGGQTGVSAASANFASGNAGLAVSCAPTGTGTNQSGLALALAP